MTCSDPYYLYFIPARGESVSIPGKNLYPIAGRPLLDWTLRVAGKSKVPHHTVVSTDDTKIADYAMYHPTLPQVYRRPPHLEGKDGVIDEEIIYFLSEGYRPYVTDIVILQPTSPIRTVLMLDSAIAEYEDHKECDSAFSGSEVEGFIWRVPNTTGDVDLGLHAPYLSRPRRQEKLYRTYQEDGSVYIVDREALIRQKSRITSDAHLIVSPKWSSFQLDTVDDIPAIETILENLECLNNLSN